jgi:hypothetical protein
VYRRIIKIVGKTDRVYLPTPPPITLSRTVPTSLPVKRFNGVVTVFNPVGNSIVLVGGLAGEIDQPYFQSDHMGADHGIRVMPGQSVEVTVTKNSRLSAIAQRNDDVIVIESILSD